MTAGPDRCNGGAGKAMPSRRRTAALSLEELQRPAEGGDDVVPAAAVGHGSDGDPAAAILGHLVRQLGQILDLALLDGDNLGERVDTAREDQGRGRADAVAVR